MSGERNVALLVYDFCVLLLHAIDASYNKAIVAFLCFIDLLPASTIYLTLSRKLELLLSKVEFLCVSCPFDIEFVHRVS